MKTLLLLMRYFQCIFLLGSCLFVSPALALVSGEEPFDTRRIPLEVQAWWVPNFGHLHAAARLPLGQAVSGTMQFDVRIVVHDNPAHISGLALKRNNVNLAFYPLDLDCPYDGVTSTTCAFNVPVSLDTTLFQDGLHVLRIRVDADTPDGELLHTSSFWPLDVQNGRPESPETVNIWCGGASAGGPGWYTDVKYSTAVLECVPLAPVSGIWPFRFMAINSTARLRVVLDGNHFIPAVGPWPEQQATVGTVLFDEVCRCTTFRELSLDTTLLANGWHTLSIQSQSGKTDVSVCEYCAGELNHLEGHMKVWFYVEN